MEFSNIHSLFVNTVILIIFCRYILADKLQVIALRGRHGEEVPFFAHLEAQGKSTVWLKLLEGIMKNTMATILQACVQSRIEEGKYV